MRLFQRRRQRHAYDPSTQQPALRCSICTGEQVAGFKDRITGRFVDVLLIRTPDDLAAFCADYGVDADAIEKIY